MARMTAAAAVRVLELEGVRTAFGVPGAAINPGRGEPGRGEINHHFLYDELDRAGYAGWIGCEYRPRGDTSAGLGWVRPYLRARDAAAA